MPTGRRPRLSGAAYEDLLSLAPTWDNVDHVFQRLWGEASRGEYQKETWAAFQRLLAGVALARDSAGVTVNVPVNSSPGA